MRHLLRSPRRWRHPCRRGCDVAGRDRWRGSLIRYAKALRLTMLLLPVPVGSLALVALRELVARRLPRPVVAPLAAVVVAVRVAAVAASTNVDDVTAPSAQPAAQSVAHVPVRPWSGWTRSARTCEKENVPSAASSRNRRARGATPGPSPFPAHPGGSFSTCFARNPPPGATPAAVVLRRREERRSPPAVEGRLPDVVRPAGGQLLASRPG